MRTSDHHVVCSLRRLSRRPRIAVALFACGWLVSVVAVGAALAAEDITTFDQLKQLSPAQAGEGRRARFQGVVLCHDLEWSQLFVHDGHETRWFDPQQILNQPETGQLVEITGTTITAGSVNGLTNLNLTVLKSGTLPSAKRLAFAQLAGDLGAWVEVSGHVRVVDFSRGRMQLLLQEGGQGCGVIVMGPPQTNELARLRGAKVRVRGINDSKLAAGGLEFASVLVPGMDEVTIVEPAAAAPVLPAVVSIDSLLNRELGEWTNSPVRINGSVVASEPGKALVVKDPTGIIHAQVMQFTFARSDDRVEVCGFLRVTPKETILSDAWFEVLRPVAKAAITPPASGGRAGKVEVLTNVSEILNLPAGEIAQHRPVRLRGVVLYADPEWHIGFFHDQRRSIFFNLNQSEVRSGQRVELTGETGPGGFAPEILNTSVKVLGAGKLPAPARLDLTDLADGHLDAQWVELEGIVRRVRQEWGHLYLSVMTPQGKFNVLVPGLHNRPTPTNLLDAFVRVQGACGSELNARRQVSGITLHAPGPDQIKILKPAPANPFAVASTPIAAVATFDPARLAGGQVKVSGVVTLKIPHQGFFVQDATGGICVRLLQLSELQAGDTVDVLGFPALGDFSPEMEEVTVRRTGKASAPIARETTADEIMLQGEPDSVLVTLEARLLQSVPRSANPQLLLQAGSIIFTARLEDAAGGWKMPALQSGSVVRLAGVCSIQRGEQHEPKSFRLRLRSASDVTLLSSPPWWTAQHTLWVLGALGGVLVISLAWVRALRRQVSRQTRKLREQIAAREQMQVQIEKTHKELLHASRQAGMAEVATSVLHNVGNVLNSVNTSASVVTDRLRISKSDGVARVVELLDQNRNDLPGFFSADGRADQVINFLRTLGQHLASERTVSLEELAELTKHIGHIKEIVAMQQSYARVFGVTESVNVVELVEDALRMNNGALARHAVELVREYPPQLPPITVDKHKVLQVLVNLIRNAKHACDDSNQPDKQMTVRVTSGDDRVRIAVIDNGVGIPSENLTRIFSHGFTTRKNGHGFGLHSGALAARELGGSLVAHSDGAGRGASFTLELPLKRTSE